MTQMLLFDTPAAANEFLPAVASVVDLPAQQAQPAPKAQPAQTQPAQTQALESDADRGGMHHMGDLARLVLMRYELVAQRRAAMAARRAK